MHGALVRGNYIPDSQ